MKNLITKNSARKWIRRHSKEIRMFKEAGFQRPYSVNPSGARKKNGRWHRQYLLCLKSLQEVQND